MSKTDIAVVILSCDKFKVTWKPCLDHFFIVWPNCPYTVYLLNNFTPSNDERVEDLLVGEDFNWSDTLKKGLLKIKEKRIFFLFDDAFITKVNLIELELIFKIAIENDLDSVNLRKKTFDRGTFFNKKLYKINPNAKYRNSLFLNLIKKNILLNLLKSGENAWQFEKDGNKRNKAYDFYSVYSSPINYFHGIVKGKWLPKTYIYLKSKGYPLNENTFEKHSKLKMLLMRYYTFIFNMWHKFTHLIK